MFDGGALGADSSEHERQSRKQCGGVAFGRNCTARAQAADVGCQDGGTGRLDGLTDGRDAIHSSLAMLKGHGLFSIQVEYSVHAKNLEQMGLLGEATCILRRVSCEIVHASSSEWIWQWPPITT
ncbi:hypothetical protein VSDG_00078 [Cytospora chrysosperma]|uniref:Uncharacterized protein n=1 Tax=Cytospora chrysosperma TaxID=252740 RepID=A0A423WQ57_CYTCH|nr:hypothetical protein VSDG_00078 [Valsa sordida]